MSTLTQPRAPHGGAALTAMDRWPLARPDTLFWAWCALHVLAWTIGPALMYSSVPRDTLEGITWGQMWQWGYEKHPPLAAWISALFTQVGGVVGWPVFLAAQLCVVLSLWAVWQLARSVLTPWAALAAAVLLDGVYYYNIGSLTLNPNIVMLPTWAMLTLAVYRVIEAPSARRWLAIGCWAGLAMLAKYESAILILVLVAAGASSPRGRAVLRQPGLWLAVAAGVVVTLPNVIWVVRHDFMPIHYALGNMALEATQGAQGPIGKFAAYPAWLEFGVEQMLACLPAALLYIAWFKLPGSLRRAATEPVTTPLAQEVWRTRFIAIVTWGALILTMLLAASTSIQLIARWGFPFFNLLGVWLLLRLRPRLTRARFVGFATSIAALQLALLAGSYWTIFVHPHQSGLPPYSITYPNTTLANTVTTQWHARYGRPLKIVAGDRWLVAGVCAYSPDRPYAFFDWLDEWNPWISKKDLTINGAVMVHVIGPDAAGEQGFMDSLHARYPALTGDQIVSLPHLSAAPLAPVKFWIGFLPPEAAIAN